MLKRGHEMTTTNSDHLLLPETVSPEPAGEPSALEATEQPQAALATTPKEDDDDDDLEEGELKDDDDDTDDDEVDGPVAPGITPQPARLLPISGSGAQYNVMQPDSGSALGQPPEPDAEQAPKKKRKKRVVRKVKKMVRVIKKVPKKKVDQQEQQQRQGQQAQQPLLPQQPMLPQNQKSQPQQQQQQQPFDNKNVAGQQRLLPHIQGNTTNTSNNLNNNNSSVTQAQPTPLLPAASQQTTGSNLDSLLEQQILMLQELQRQQQQPAPQQQQQQHQPPPPHLFNQSDQQHAQILRAAATDEDLRYLQPPYLLNAPTMQHQIQPFISHSNPITMPYTTTIQNVSSMAPSGMMTSPNLLNSMANNNILRPNQPAGMLSQTDGLTPMMQQQLHLISQQNQSLAPQQATPLLPQSQSSHLQYPNQSIQQPLGQFEAQHQHQHQQQQQQHQNQPMLQANQQQPDHTPSSPDDESSKSSYEAISKMLTLLRNSANISETSETNNQAQNDSPGDAEEASQSKEQNEVEYSLIPVLVQGIDYTKYKLLSQYEPKFKNDPRLNTQA